jgi:hypothetical protein
MKKIGLILVVLTALTGCQLFGYRPAKPKPSPNLLTLANLKGKWAFYTDTVMAFAGSVGSSQTHDYNDMADYYYQFTTDSIGLVSLGTAPNSQFGFTYKLTNNILTLKFMDVANNPNFKFPNPMGINISGFSLHKAIFQTTTTDTINNSSLTTTLQLTR